MRKYFYNNPMNPKKYLNCIKQAKEWKNQDLPNIYRTQDKSLAIEVTFPEYKINIFPDNAIEAKLLEDFVISNTGKEPEVYL